MSGNSMWFIIPVPEMNRAPDKLKGVKSFNGFKYKWQSSFKI